MPNALTFCARRPRHLLSHIVEHWPWRYTYFWSNIWNVNCARTTAFIYDTRTGVLVKVSKFLRQKMSRPERNSKPQSSDILSFHTVIRQSEYIGPPSGINHIPLLFLSIEIFEEKGEEFSLFQKILESEQSWSYSYCMCYSYTHCYYEIGTHEKPNNPVIYCCHMPLAASMKSICLNGNHR